MDQTTADQQDKRIVCKDFKPDVVAQSGWLPKTKPAKDAGLVSNGLFGKWRSVIYWVPFHHFVLN
jgi:hypothetical protein